MNTRTTLLALLMTAPLLACSPSTPSSNTASSTGSDADKGLIARHVDKALDEARAELAKGNIDISDGPHIVINGNDRHHEKRNLPKAEITPKGDFLIEGKTIAINETQRQQLMDYRGHVINIATAGIALGGKGAAMADTALSGVAGAIFGGEKGNKDFEAKMEAEGKKLEAEAQKLCALLPGMMSRQQVLATSLPAFKPYATMTQAEIDDCGKDAKDKGVAVMSQ